MEVRSALYNCLEIKTTCSVGVNKELDSVYIVKSEASGIGRRRTIFSRLIRYYRRKKTRKKKKENSKHAENRPAAALTDAFVTAAAAVASEWCQYGQRRQSM